MPTVTEEARPRRLLKPGTNRHLFGPLTLVHLGQPMSGGRRPLSGGSGQPHAPEAVRRRSPVPGPGCSVTARRAAPLRRRHDRKPAGRFAQAKVDPGCRQLPVVLVRCRRLERGIWTSVRVGWKARDAHLGAGQLVCAGVLIGHGAVISGLAGCWAWCWAGAGWAEGSPGPGPLVGCLAGSGP